MNTAKLIFVLWIGLIVGMATSDVGTIPDCGTEPYDWWLPICIGLFSAFPYYLGFKSNEP